VSTAMFVDFYNKMSSGSAIMKLIFLSKFGQNPDHWAEKCKISVWP